MQPSYFSIQESDEKGQYASCTRGGTITRYPAIIASKAASITKQFCYIAPLSELYVKSKNYAKPDNTIARNFAPSLRTLHEKSR